MEAINIDPKVMDALRAIGLNLYERKLWIALLSKGTATAGELAELSNVPRSRCYDVLESLADKGFVIIQPAKPMRYVAVKPKEALERAKQRLLKKAEEMVERIERLKSSEVLKELEQIYESGIETIKPEDLSGALRGRESFYEHMGSLLQKAKRNVSILVTEQGLIEIYRKYLRIFQKLSKRGIDVKILAPIESENAREVAQELGRYAKIKDISRLNRPKPLSRVCSVDGEHFLITLTDESEIAPGREISFWANSKHAAQNFFEPIFNLLWEEGKEVA